MSLCLVGLPVIYRPPDNFLYRVISGSWVTSAHSSLHFKPDHQGGAWRHTVGYPCWILDMVLYISSVGINPRLIFFLALFPGYSCSLSCRCTLPPGSEIHYIQPDKQKIKGFLTVRGTASTPWVNPFRLLRYQVAPCGPDLPQAVLLFHILLLTVTGSLCLRSDVHGNSMAGRSGGSGSGWHGGAAYG